MIHEDLELILEDASEGMDKCIEHLRHEMVSIRAGRATPSMLENVRVEYYGSVTPLSQISSINAPQHDLLVVQPWDASALGAIEKAIMAANLGLNPSNDGALIRLPVPPLSEERRRDLAKGAKAKGEDAKIAIRGVRRNAKEMIKSTQKEEKLPEDMAYEAEETLQAMTDKHIAKIESIMAHKEAEIMEV
jgi:ribosome recycling factor